MLGGGRPGEGVEVGGVFGDIAQVHPFAAGSAVATVVQRVGDQTGVGEPRRDVVVAAGVLGVSVGEHHDAPGLALVGGPDVVDDADAADTGETVFGVGHGHSRETIRPTQRCLNCRQPVVRLTA